MKKKYVTPDGFTCPECGYACTIVPLDNSFSYSGTHCTAGRSGVHRPAGYGMPVTDCCEVFVEAEEDDIEPDYEPWDDEDAPRRLGGRYYRGW
jgi:hypothetical protein